MKRAPSPARKATSAATSCGSPYRPSATWARSPSACGLSAGFMSVLIGPGSTRLAVMPRGPRSRARPLVRPTSAALLIAYRLQPASGTRSERQLPMLITLPPGAMCGTAARVAITVAAMCTATSASSCASVVSSMAPPA